VSWRGAAISEFEKHGFDGRLIVPEFRRPRWDSNLTTDQIIEWEYENLCTADAIMFWIPRTELLIGLTTNHELGYWSARNQAKCVYGRPDDAVSIAYTDNMWKREWERTYRSCSGLPPKIHTTLEDTVYESINRANTRYMVSQANPDIDFRKE
jgi:hypothetical protein